MLGRMLLAGLLLLVPLSLEAQPEGPRRTLNPAAFRLAKVEKGDLARVVQFEGVLRPEQFAPLRSRVSGAIDKILVRQGQRVKAGDLLVQMDARGLELSLDLARVQLQKLRSDVEAAEAQRKLAETQYERLRRLYETKAASEPEVLAARAALSTAQARTEEVRATAQLAEIALRKAQLDVEGTRLVAPFEGQVLEVFVTPGEVVNAGAERLVLLASPSETLLFRAVFEGREFPEIKAGLVLQVGDVPAKVERVGPVWREIDDLPRQVLEAQVANPKLELAPFQRATAKVPLGTLQGVLMVPASALAWRPLPEEVEAGTRDAYREFKYRNGSSDEPMLTLFADTGLKPVKVEVLAVSAGRAAIKGPLKESDIFVVGRAGLE